MLNKRALFALQKHTGLQAFYTMPHVLRYVHAIGTTLLTDDTGLQYLAVIIIGGHFDLTLQDDKSLGFGGMVMHGYLRAWHQYIQEPVALLIQTLMEVVVHPEPWRLLCLLCHAAYQVVVDNFHILTLM